VRVDIAGAVAPLTLSEVAPGRYEGEYTIRLRDKVQPNRLFLGHAYRSQGCESLGVELNRVQAAEKIQESIDIEARVRAATRLPGLDGASVPRAVHSPFCCIAQHLGYHGDPRLEPSPFFTTMHGYFHLGDRA
jgi:hypothetical protein